VSDSATRESRRAPVNCRTPPIRVDPDFRSPHVLDGAGGEAPAPVGDLTVY